MHFSEQLIEQIVSEVLSRLDQHAPSAQPAVNEKPAGNEPPIQKVLRMNGRVISTSQLDGKLKGVEQLEVQRGAVLTPALRDLLKQHSVSVTYRIPVPPGAGSKNSQLIIGVAETAYDPAELLAKLRHAGLDAAHLAGRGLVAVTEQLADAVLKQGKRALLITDNCPAALCLANRHAGLRAAAATNAQDVQDALAAIGMNLLVLCPRGRSLFQLVQAIRRFAEAEEPRCPEAYRSQLT